MTRIFIAGFQHETNTFAPSKADWAAFNRGDSFAAFVRGEAMVAQLADINLPVGGFIHAARERGWALWPSAWAGAIPSAHVTEDAFERIAGPIAEDLRQAVKDGIDAVYLDLHGAAVAEHLDDAEGELMARLRTIVGPAVPIVVSLDLHANVTAQMLHEADALAAYRTYPHIDMADTGRLAAELLSRRLACGTREALAWRRLPFLISINAQSTWRSPARERYAELVETDAKLGTVTSFCMGFPAADIAECGAVIWSHGATDAAAQAAVDTLYAQAAQRAAWQVAVPDALDAVEQALQLAAGASKPVVIADTQDNPGGGGDSNTTGVLHALLAAGAGRRFAGRVALGLLCDTAAASAAHAAGLGASITLEPGLGKSVPTFNGHHSDPPVRGTFKVVALADGVCTLSGPMMPGVTVRLGPCACLEIDGVLVAVTSHKKQLLDRSLLQMLGIDLAAMKIVVVKSSNHFRADFEPHASHVLLAKAAGPLAADPADLPWQKLPEGMRRGL
jgi:microcystin degradation protein MlrC